MLLDLILFRENLSDAFWTYAEFYHLGVGWSPFPEVEVEEPRYNGSVSYDSTVHYRVKEMQQQKCK